MRCYYLLKDICHKSSRNELIVLCQDNADFRAIFLDPIQKRGKCVVEASFKEKEHVLDFCFNEFWLELINFLRLFKGFLVVIVRNFIQKFVFFTIGEDILDSCRSTLMIMISFLMKPYLKLEMILFLRSMNFLLMKLLAAL